MRLAMFVLAAFVFLGLPAKLAAEEIRVGVSLGLTGPNALPSLMQSRAYELCESESNDSGGVLGHPLAFTIKDDEGNPKRVERFYDSFTSNGGIDIILAPYSSDLTAVAARIAEERGFPMLAPGAASDTLWKHGYQNLIGILTPASRYTIGILNLAAKQKLHRIALLHAGDEFSNQIAEGTRRWAPFVKLSIVSDIELPASLDIGATTLAKVRDSDADVIIVAGYANDAAAVRRKIAELDWQPKVYFATVGPALQSWADEMKDLAEGAFSYSMWEPPQGGALGIDREFVDKFHRRFGIDPSYHAAAAFAACQVMVAAITEAGSLDNDAYRIALFKLDLDTVLGRFAVDDTGMQIKRVDLVIQWIDGKKEIVWPPELQTATPVFEVKP